MGMDRWLVVFAVLLCCLCAVRGGEEKAGGEKPGVAGAGENSPDDDGEGGNGADKGVEDEDCDESEDDCDLKGENKGKGKDQESEDVGKGNDAEGRSLSSNQDPCDRNLCPTGTQCVNAGYGGFRCEDSSTNQDPCDPNPCLIGTRCRASNGGGFTCDQVLSPSPCNPDPCAFGQRCIRTGYNAHTCEDLNRVKDPCVPNPCPAGHRCLKADYFGFQCTPALPPNPCESLHPCLNGGTCVPTTATRYRCSCLSGFVGSHCETPPPLNPSACYPDPCSNGCRCIESCRHASGYYCKSDNGYLGKNCTIPPPVVRCDPNQITVTVDDAFVREYDMGVRNARLFIAHLPDSSPSSDCFATFNGIAHSFTVPIPFNKCGTSVDNSGDDTVVVNNIWLNRVTNGAYDMPVPVICFECTYTKEYSFVTSIQPAYDMPPPVRATGKVHVQGTIELCKVENTCPSSFCPRQFAVTQGAAYTVGEMMHVIIGGGDQGVVAVRSLFLSCGGQQVALPVVNLVSNGCPASAANRMPTFVRHSGLSSSVCVSFQVPRLRGCSTFYIHAQMESCGSTGCVTACGPTGRRRRAVRRDYDVEVDDVYGPIYLFQGSQGIPNEILFPDRTVVNSTAKIIDVPVRVNPLPADDYTAVSPTESRDKSLAVIVTAAVLSGLFIIAIASVLLIRSVPRFSLLR